MIRAALDTKTESLAGGQQVLAGVGPAVVEVGEAIAGQAWQALAGDPVVDAGANRQTLVAHRRENEYLGNSRQSGHQLVQAYVGEHPTTHRNVPGRVLLPQGLQPIDDHPLGGDLDRGGDILSRQTLEQLRERFVKCLATSQLVIDMTIFVDWKQGDDLTGHCRLAESRQTGQLSFMAIGPETAGRSRESIGQADRSAAILWVAEHRLLATPDRMQLLVGIAVGRVLRGVAAAVAAYQEDVIGPVAVTQR